MIQFLSSTSQPSYNDEVRNALTAHDQHAALKVAVAFWGRQAEKILSVVDGMNPDQCRFVCNLESGATNVAVVEAMMTKKIQIRSNPRLHAKVFITSCAAIIGSANLSTNGLGAQTQHGEDPISAYWDEAGVLTHSAEVIKDTTAWFEALWDDPRTHVVSKSDIDQAKENQKNRPLLPTDWHQQQPMAALESWLQEQKVSIAIWHKDEHKTSSGANAVNRAQAKELKLSKLNFYEDWPKIKTEWVLDLCVSDKEPIDITWWFKLDDMTTDGHKVQHVLPLDNRLPDAVRTAIGEAIRHRIDEKKLAKLLANRESGDLLRTVKELREFFARAAPSPENCVARLKRKLELEASTGGLVYIKHGDEGYPDNFAIDGLTGRSGLWANHLQNKPLEWIMVFHKVGERLGDVWLGRAAGRAQVGAQYEILMDELQGPLRVEQTFKELTGREAPQNPIYA